MEEKQLSLSDEEIQRIAKEVCANVTRELYTNIGEGVFSLIWKGVIVCLIALAAYGSAGHFFK